MKSPYSAPKSDAYALFLTNFEINGLAARVNWFTLPASSLLHGKQNYVAIS
ncbi:hypothetical protein [Ewingella americana]|uniref:hypothetical protein n=1 Tax=Ewingella americana TaxID=41202 RepID=UPI0013A536E9|nr:hypothetical protein [Ewingella americana]